MTTGEFEFDSIFRQFPGGAEPESVTEEIPFPRVSFVIWIVFLVLMPILLTNLLVSYCDGPILIMQLQVFYFRLVWLLMTSKEFKTQLCFAAWLYR